MSIEMNEDDGAVRGLLGTAFAEAEPPLRDLASGSIARGDAQRRRNRMFAVGGATLSAVAVMGTFALVSGATPGGHGNQGPVNQVSSAASSADPSGKLPFGPVLSSVQKVLDVRRQLPGLLQPLLPEGITVGSSTTNFGSAPLSPAVLTGATGTNQVTMWVGTAPTNQADVIKVVACPARADCQTKAVDGGTVYIHQGSSTAADLVRAGGDYYPADILKASTAKTVAARDLSVTFVPDDRTKYAFNIQVTTTTAKLQYADHEPSDYPTGAQWPPDLNRYDTSYDPSGLLVSADDVVAMLAKPGLNKLEYLLDPHTAVSKDTLATFTQTESQISAAAAPALPAGVKAGVDTSMMQTRLVVTGPTGKNTLTWETGSQETFQRSISSPPYPPDIDATTKTVPGGKLVVWREKPMDSKGTILSTEASAYQYWFFPADANKPAVTMTLGLDASQTGTPGRDIPDPGQTYSVADGPYVAAQVSEDQFLAAVQSGELSTAIATTTSLLATLQ
ncbi:hypothetical protein KGQ20_26545 [Catenulispora sp. NF23]|uniref:hypothetical protein n=1 Tax=Catenulispora pinistramenti TaxID=2705254 RepID=UPI001BA5BBF8|nr:hypothetical protein [Catenulispora pinistramenti]MBS2536330.1 hypothetical protein [Catenulispora pinistramenti]